MLNYKKPTIWLITVMVIIVVAIIIGISSDPINSEPLVELTKEQIEQVNKAFMPIVIGDDGKDGINPLSHFLTSYYEKPEDIDLAYMLYHFPSEENITEDEFEALKAHDNWPFGEVTTIENMPVPIHRIPANSVDAALKQYMDISLDDVIVKNPDSLIFLDKYNAYYNFTSDFAPGFFTCISGKVQGDTVTLYGKDEILTLKKKDDGYLFISHIKAE